MKLKPEDEAEFDEWLRGEKPPLDNLKASVMSISIFPADGKNVDPRFLLQLGASIYYNKPLLVAVPKGGPKVSPRVYAFADEVVELDDSNPEASQEALSAAVKRILKKHEGIDLDKQ